MDKNEKKILAGIKRGDVSAFQKIFQIYYNRLFLYAKSYIENHDVAEDIVQDLFFHLWEKRKDILITSSLSSYFFRAIHNKCIQYLRHQKVALGFAEKHKLKLKEAEILYSSSGDFNFSELKFKEISDIITKTYKTLPLKTKEVFKLSREQSYTNLEISKELKITVKTVEYHISKALQIFRIALKDYFIFFVFLKIMLNLFILLIN